jgi:hypothetical protein
VNGTQTDPDRYWEVPSSVGGSGGAGCTTPPIVSAVACCRMLAEVAIESYPCMVNRC